MAKKDKASKLPKKVAGVKLPKPWRKSAKTALALAQNPLAREILSAALIAGAAAVTKGKTHKTNERARPAASQGGDKLPDLGALLAQSVTAFIDGFGKGAGLMGDGSTTKRQQEPKAPGESAKKT